MHYPAEKSQNLKKEVLSFAQRACEHTFKSPTVGDPQIANVGFIVENLIDMKTGDDEPFCLSFS